MVNNMRKKPILLLTTILIAGIAFGSCTKEPPKPGTPVTFDTVCSKKYDPEMVKGLQEGPRVALEGYMGLSGMFMLQSSTLMITLFSEPGRKGKTAHLSLKVGSDENEIEKLGKKYKLNDMKVHTKDDKIVGPGDRVRVHGMRLGSDKSCYIKVDLVEKL